MTENFNTEDPFGFDEPEQKQKEPKKLNWIQRFFAKMFIMFLEAMASRAMVQIREQQYRKKHYKRVIKQGWFGEYSEWHERQKHT